MKSTLLLVIAVIMLFACQKESSYQCSGNWSSVTDTGCLVSTITYASYKVRTDGSIDSNSGNNKEQYTYYYDGRKLKSYFPPYRPKYTPCYTYEYNACNQVNRIYYSSDERYGKSMREILYLDDGSGRIDKEILTSITTYNNVRTGYGYIQHYYRKNVVYSCQFDSLKNKVSTLDSTIYNDAGLKLEVWSSGQKIVYKIKDNNKPSIGDEIITTNLSDNGTLVAKTDSVFLNENGMDTLTYTSYWFNNEYTGFGLKRTKYIGCK